MKAAWLMAIVLLAACGGLPTAAQTSSTPSKAGPLADTWSWNGTTWHRESSAGPTARYFAALAYDARRNVYVLFGGQTAKGPSDETWTWDGAKWREMSPMHKPPPRRAAAMAYDPMQQVVVLYGGLIPDSAEGHASGDSWTWDGSDWTQVDQGPGPPGVREGPVAVTALDRTILFGGHNANANYFGDAWSWIGNTWVRVDTGANPPGRGNSAVVWDGVDSSVLVFGGSGFNASGGPGAQGTPLSDAWSLSGSTWTQLNSAGPGRLAFANAIWDRAGRRAIVLLGMPCPDPSDAAWAWDGKAWVKLANPGMSARWGAALGQAVDGNALLFGGSNERGC
jgi:hypothetical protein